MLLLLLYAEVTSQFMEDSSFVFILLEFWKRFFICCVNSKPLLTDSAHCPHPHLLLSAPEQPLICKGVHFHSRTQAHLAGLRALLTLRSATRRSAGFIILTGRQTPFSITLQAYPFLRTSQSPAVPSYPSWHLLGKSPSLLSCRF